MVKISEKAEAPAMEREEGFMEQVFTGGGCLRLIDGGPSSSGFVRSQ